MRYGSEVSSELSSSVDSPSDSVIIGAALDADELQLIDGLSV